MFSEVKLYTETHGVQLIAVTKTRTVGEIMALYNQGQRHMGENRVQELLAKKENLPDDIHWHLIGHLQSNKVKYIAPFVHLIHSVDSLDLYQTIVKEAEKAGRTIDILLQFHIAREETKFGLSYTEAEEIVTFHTNPKKTVVRIRGVMGMATLTEDEAEIRKEFSVLKSYFDRLKTGFFTDDDSFREISMGMSSDYRIAIEEGSTMVRVGSLLFS
jgi:pyridoxal phosphate enzyme (YggS family)